METVVITGGSGLIGNHLAKFLVEEDYNVILLSRTPDKNKGSTNIRFAGWNPSIGEIDKKLLKKPIILYIWLEKILVPKVGQPPEKGNRKQQNTKLCTIMQKS